MGQITTAANYLAQDKPQYILLFPSPGMKLTTY